MKKKKIKVEIAADAIGGQPNTAMGVVDKYGTYEIQPTADTDNPFPKIAQGLPAEKNRKQK